MNSAVTVADILNWLDGWAPFSSAEEWDNVGLLVGCTDTPVTKVLFSLDITPEVVMHAAKLGAELIISHHPVIFNPLKKLESNTPPYLLARHGIAVIAAHTNLDKAVGGVNDTLASKLLLKDVCEADDGMCRIGTLECEMSPEMFAKHCASMLNVPDGGINWTDGKRPVRTVAVCGGSGGDFLHSLQTQVDAFVTGELNYHDWPANALNTIVAAGHFYTEAPAVEELKNKLQSAFKAIKTYLAHMKCPYQIL
ncbi:MAG: Nif3-like dinuclear metal center hexameric protein [Oscillospiraceae bacterium]|nr:Nif3-like dinuclear metal center hexameric protein [Oscillospiraceae bacterium]